MKRLNLAIIYIICTTQYVSAETAYISDVWEAPVLSEKNKRNPDVIKLLSSGTSVTILDTDINGLWKQIKISDGSGWIKSDYLQKTPTARNLLKTSKKTIKSLSKANKNLKQEVSELNEKLEATHKELANAQFKEKIANSKKAISSQLNFSPTEKNEIIKKNILLKIDIETLSAENIKLQEDRNQQYYINAAITICLGFLFGWYFSKRGEKNTGGWS